VTKPACTVGGWLARRTPRPPELLRESITSALGAAAERDVSETEHACLDAAERVLARLLQKGRGERDDASDLLAADALLTYALEFASDGPERFEQNATNAIERFGRLGQDET
jgi:hypothetical protein